MVSKGKYFVVLVAIAALLLGALPAFAQDAVASVNTGAVNVRSGPGMQYGSIATLPFGFGVNLLARNTAGNWVQIGLTNGVTGWVNVNYLFTNYPVRNLPITEAPVAPSVVPTGTITGFVTATLRNGPSTSNAAIRQVPQGTPVTLLGRNYNSTWAQVRLSDGTVGWVEAVGITGTVPVRSLALADGSVFVPGAPSVPPTSGQPQGTLYTIRPGDTLWAIAQRFGVNMHTLAAYNRIYNYDLIYAGQQLIIPS